MLENSTFGASITYLVAGDIYESIISNVKIEL